MNREGCIGGVVDCVCEVVLSASAIAALVYYKKYRQERHPRRAQSDVVGPRGDAFRQREGFLNSRSEMETKEIMLPTWDGIVGLSDGSDGD